MTEKNKDKKFVFYYQRILLVCFSISILINLIQIAGGFPDGVWQYGIALVILCLGVYSFRKLLINGGPNLKPYKVEIPKRNIIELIIYGCILGVWVISLFVVMVVV